MHRSTLALLLAVAVAQPLAAQWPPEPPAPPRPAERPAPARAPRPVPEPHEVSAPRAPHASLPPLGVGEMPLLVSASAPPGYEERRHSQDPADSTYREARRALNRGEWRHAASLFASIPTRFPNSEYRADALYWQAFSLYRIGGATELRDGLTALEARRTRFPNADSQSEATALATRIRGALAARGDAAATAEVAREAARGVTSCDEEDLSVRSSALSALMRADPAAAQPQLERVLARRDACSEPLRKGAVMMLGDKGDAASRARLVVVATLDPSTDVKVDAIGYLGRLAGDDAVDALQRILRGEDEERVKRAAVRALGRHSSPRAREAIRNLVERRDASERLRLEALGTFDRGQGEDHETNVECANDVCSVVNTSSGTRPRVSGLTVEEAAWLRGVYVNLGTVPLKSRAASVLVRATDDASVTWLMNLVQREEEPAEVRAAVLARLGRTLSIVQLGRLYDGAANRVVRRQIVSTLGDRTEPAATDKLIEIVRTGTDPQLRRSAISALTRKNDPRTTQLLLEMIDR